MNLKIYCDGGARGNPGPAAIGVMIYDAKGQLLRKIGRYIGSRTNNQAEYEAVIRGLKEALSYQPDEIDFYLDSELIVNQLKGIYKIKNQGLKPLYQTSRDLISKFKRVNFHHLKRKDNQEADRLVNQALNQAGF